jgi:TP901 family phage tail tape measure protein
VADYNLGTARGRIRTQYDNTGVSQAEKSLKGLDKTAAKSGDGFKKLAAGSGVATVALAAGLVLVTKSAIDFQKQISEIGAVSGATSDQMEALRAKALQLGADTAFSASEAANAMTELAKAGVSVPDILNGAADAAVNLAAAGGIDLPEAAEIAANALGQFNLQAKDLAHVVDLIAGAANASAISVDDFNLSMKQAGAVANLVGVNFDDMAVAIALMGRNGIKGSDAGTSLKTMLLNLQPATKKQTDAFRELGLITKDGSNIFFDAHGNLKSLADISDILQEKTKKMTAAQKSATLELLFGSDAIRAAAILTKNGAEGFNEMATAMGKVKAADVAKARLDNVAGSIEQLKGSLETGAITIGSVLLPAIKKITDFVTRLVNGFNKLDPQWQKFIAFALVAATALAGLVTVVATIGAAIAGVSAALAVIGSGGIVAAVIAGIAAIVAGIIILWKKSSQFRAAIQGIFAVIGEHISKMREVIQPFINFVKNELIPLLQVGFKKAIDALGPAFLAINQFFREKVEPALRGLREALTAAMPTIIKVARFLGQGLVLALVGVGKAISFVLPLLLKVAGFVFPLLINVIAFLIRNIPTFVSVIKTIGSVLFTIGKIIAIAVIAPFYLMWKVGTFVFNALMTAVGNFIAFWRGVWDFIAPVVIGAFNLVKSIIGAAISVITAIITVFWTVIKAVFGAAVDFLTAVFAPAFNFIKDVITSVFNFLAPYIIALWNDISAKISAAVNFIKAVISVAWNVIKTVFTTVWGAISSFISATWERIKAIISAAVTVVVNTMNGIKKIVDNVKAFFNQLKEAASGGTGTLIDFVKGIPAKILAALGNVGSMLYGAGKKIIQGLIDGIGDMIGKLKDKIGDVIGVIGRFLPGSPAKEGPLSGQGYVKIRGQHLTEDFAVGIESQAKMVEEAVRRMIQGLSGQVPNPSTGGFVAATTQQTATGLAAQIRPTVTAPSPSAPDVTIQNLNVNGVWDFSDPLVERKIAARVSRAITDYQKGYK